MYAYSHSLESSQVPKWLLQDWTPNGCRDEVPSQPVSHLVPCALCISLVPWNFTFTHPFIASQCIRLCRNCLESIENRRMELADRGLIFSTMDSNERVCACCCSESQKSQELFTCVGCTRSYCKVCVTRILGEYAVATGLVQLQAWFCPLCVRFNLQAKETLKSSRRDQFVLLSLVSFAQARNWETPKALAPLNCRSLERKALEFAFENIAGPDEKVLERYEVNFRNYCNWLNEREQRRLEQNKGMSLVAKNEQVECNGVVKNESVISSALCFWCKEPEATITCSFPKCNKTYHRNCIMSEVVEGADWICPWHACLSCGAVESNENILRKCRTCPLSFCALHIPGKSGYEEEVYYYDEHYILCQRCTPFVERPQLRPKRWEESLSTAMIPNKNTTHHNTVVEVFQMEKYSSNQETSKEWKKRSRVEKATEEENNFNPRELRPHRVSSKSFANTSSYSLDELQGAATSSHSRRAGRKADDVNSRIVRLVAERSQDEPPIDMDKVKEFIQEDIEELGVSGPCRLAALYVLKKAGRPLTTSEIAERMVLEGLWLPTGATPVNTIAGLLSSDSKKAKEKNGSYIYFDRLGPSLFVYNRRGRG